MSNKHGARTLSILLALLAAGGASAQTPAGFPQLDVATVPTASFSAARPSTARAT